MKKERKLENIRRDLFNLGVCNIKKKTNSVMVDVICNLKIMKMRMWKYNNKTRWATKDLNVSKKKCLQPFLYLYYDAFQNEMNLTRSAKVVSIRQMVRTQERLVTSAESKHETCFLWNNAY